MSDPNTERDALLGRMSAALPSGPAYPTRCANRADEALARELDDKARELLGSWKHSETGELLRRAALRLRELSR